MNKQETIEKYTKLVKSGEMSIEEVRKALKAGYDAPIQMTQKEIKVDMAVQERIEAEGSTNLSKEELAEMEAMFGGNFKLGSTFVDTPQGRVLTNTVKGK